MNTTRTTSLERFNALVKVKNLMPEASPEAIGQLARWVDDGITRDDLSVDGLDAATTAMIKALKSSGRVPSFSDEECVGIAVNVIHAYLCP